MIILNKLHQKILIWMKKVPNHKI